MVLLAEDGVLTNGAVAQLDKEPTNPAMLVAPVPNAEPGPPVQGVPRVEAAAEDPVDGSEEGDWKREGSVEGVGRTGRREVQPGGAGLPLDHGRGQTGAGGGAG